jgi:hypothetical protein
MSAQITVPASAFGLDFRADCNYSAGHPGCRYQRNGDPGDPPEPAECEIVALSVNVGDKRFDCTYLMSSDLADQISDAVELNAGAVAKEDDDERRADAAESQERGYDYFYSMA